MVKKVKRKKNKKVDKKINKKTNEKINKKTNEKINKKIDKKINKKANKKINKKANKKINKKAIKKVSKKIDERLKNLKENKKLAFKIDLRKLSKYQRRYVKRIRQGYIEGEWRKKLTRYIALGLVEYYKLFNQKELIKNLPKEIGISKTTFTKILKGIKVSKGSYQKFNNFLNDKISNYETSFLFVIAEYVKKSKGKISKKIIEKIVKEIYELLNYFPPFEDLGYYDLLHIYYN